MSAAWTPTSRIRLAGLSSLYRASARRHRASTNARGEVYAERGSPLLQNQLRSYINLPRSFELDATVFHVTRKQALGVPGYKRLDVRLGYRPRTPWEFSVGAENVAGRKHIEHVSEELYVPRTAIGRIVYGKLTLRF